MYLRYLHFSDENLADSRKNTNFAARKKVLRYDNYRERENRNALKGVGK